MHCRQDRYDMPGWDGGVSFVVYPPFVERAIRANVETLFWRRGLCERVTYVRTKNEKIFRCGHCIEEAGAGLVNTVSINFVKDFY